MVLRACVNRRKTVQNDANRGKGYLTTGYQDTVLMAVLPIDVRDWNRIAMGHSRAGGSRPTKNENEDLDEQVRMLP